MARTYKAKVETPTGRAHASKPRSNARGRKPLVARFGGIPLKRQRKAILPTVNQVRASHRRKGDLITRLLRSGCEICEQRAERSKYTRSASSPISPGPGTTAAGVDEHHDQKRRKTLVVCPPCHDTIHAAGNQPQAHGVVTGEPATGNFVRRVRWGATRKRTRIPPGTSPRWPTLRLDCLKPNLQKVQRNARRKDA